METIASASPGEWLTRGTAWLALFLYTAAEVARALTPRRHPAPVARWLNTAGFLVFVVHIACAFSAFHHWSHTAAYVDTARQTAQFTGMNWGGGLYINYAFALVWLGEAILAWASPARYLHRPPWITHTVRGFFLFMIFNGAVVFVHGTARWFGLGLCLVLVICWWPRKNQSPATT